MMKNLIILILSCLVIGLGLMLLDFHTASNEAVLARLELHEKKLKEKTRPIIQVTRATIYNTDGEIVIEEIPGKKKPAQQK